MDSDIRYRANPDFLLREIAGEFILVPTGDAAVRMNGLISLNETGACLWKLLQHSRSEAELVSALLEEYEVEPAAAAADVRLFLTRLDEAGILLL